MDVCDEKELQGKKLYEKDIDLKQTFHQKRAIQREEIRNWQIRGPGKSSITRSLQKVDVKYNLIKLGSLLNATSSQSRKNKLNGLITILETLFTPSSSRTDIDIFESHSPEYFYPRGIIDFEEALELYADFIGAESVRKDDLSTRFRDDLLHPEHGLRCLIYSNELGRKFVVLDSDDLDLYNVFQYLLTSDSVERAVKTHPVVNYDFVQQALNSMDSEHDKHVLKAILAKFLTAQELSSVGVDPHALRSISKRLTTTFEEISNASTAAEDMMNLRLQSKVQRTESQISHIDDILAAEDLPEIRKQDLYAKKEILLENVLSNKNLLTQASKKYKQRFKQCVKRLANKLVKENRIKSRCLGAGAKPLLDTDDEEYVAAAIESKSSAHGRRHDTVLYLNHRVKSEDLLSIANYNLMKKGKKLIRSSRTVSLRSRPRRINTREGQRHTGHWLFCAKKPPKTEDHETILTHHQRACVSLNRKDMFGEDSILGAMSLDISFDDKAYIRPGTDVGFRDTKAGKILQVTDESKQRKLPQHDFGTPHVYQTPSSFRYMTWKEENLCGHKKLIKVSDESHVIVRPKYYVGSSGCVWASDLMRLRIENPDMYEIKSERNIPIIERKVCAEIHDNVYYFMDTTTDEDLESIRKGDHFRVYEEKRIQHMMSTLKKVCFDLGNTEIARQNIGDDVEKVLKVSENLCCILSNGNLDTYISEIPCLVNLCEELLNSIDSMNLPPVKTIIAEYTDAGPGVGISNNAVRFRFAEMCRIHNTARRVRIHRASGDSAQNEAERTNSAIGDALVDGATLKWDAHKPLDELSDEEIQNLSSSDLEMRKEKALEKNAWDVAEQVCVRIDQAKGPAGDFLHAYVTDRPDERFFWNSEYLKKYTEASKSTKVTIPGHGYFKKIHDFLASHFESGELYMEYRKNSCLDDDGERCVFCTNSKDSGFGEIPIKPFPKPFPGANFHYKSIQETPVDNRSTDDYQPRVQLKKLFSEGHISSSKPDTVLEFSKKYIVNEDCVQQYLQHLESLKLQKDKRLQLSRRNRIERAEKTYTDFDWIQMFEQNLIEKQSVQTLDKYLVHHKLGSFHYKAEKVQVIQRHIASSLTLPQISDDDDDDDEDLVIEAYDSESEESDDSEESESDTGESGNETEEREREENRTEVNITNSRRSVKKPSWLKDYTLL